MKLTFSQRCKAFFAGEVEVPEPAPAPPPSPLSTRTIVIGSYNGFTLSLWRQSTDHIKWAQGLFEQPKFQDLLAVLSNAIAHPTHIPDHKTTDAYARDLGRFLGYRELLGVLLSLPRFPEAPKPDVEADYNAETVLKDAMTDEELEALPDYQP